MQQTAIDRTHAFLVFGLVVAFKPTKVLEFGLGPGISGAAILDGIKFNRNAATHTIVDNWHDFKVLPRPVGFVGATIITSNEKDFVEACLRDGEKFDFIFSDADHLNADKWFDETYGELLSAPGVLIYHDIASPDFPNLKTIHDRAVRRNLPHFLFNRESRSDERCSRGLLVIFKYGG